MDVGIRRFLLRRSQEENRRSRRRASENANIGKGRLRRGIGQSNDLKVSPESPVSLQINSLLSPMQIAAKCGDNGSHYSLKCFLCQCTRRRTPF
jgi:hypothetical protein